VLLFGMDTLGEPETHAKTFCAYGKVFVEFRERGRVWGALMLDNGGRPIPCEEDGYSPRQSVSEGVGI
jgi:hypothetical protein